MQSPNSPGRAIGYPSGREDKGRAIEIDLHWGPGVYALFALATGGPGFVLGAVCGAILWRGHRFWGATAGALAGGAVLIGFFLWWADGPASVSLDYFAAMARAALHSLPGLIAGAAIGAWRWPARRLAGAVAGGLIGAVLGLAVWIAISGAL
ncbi:MAG TPA: hypothetical protein VGH15_08525 [Caulobacteraceae bacterium]